MIDDEENKAMTEIVDHEQAVAKSVGHEKLDSIEHLGSTPEERLSAAISKYDVFIVSKSTCPFCIEVKDTFSKHQVPATFIDADSIKEGKNIQSAVSSMNDGHKTVPAIWIKGKFIGGCDAAKLLEANGELRKLVQDIKNYNVVSDHDRGNAVDPLMWFPSAVSNQVIRITGVLVSILAILGIIFREDLWGQYIVVFLLVDFCFRFMAGASASVLGMIATVLSAPMGSPNLKPGFPKQFASFCGICFTATTVGCYFSGNYIAGAVVLGILLACAALEGFFNFCVGCLFFGFAIQLKMLPTYLYKRYANTRAETLDQWEYMNSRSNPAELAPVAAVAGTRSLDLKYKVKTDEWTRDSFNVLKYVQISYFAIPMSIAGLAFAWKLSSCYAGSFSLATANAWYQTFGIAAAVFYFGLLILYTIKVVLFFSKVKKEWDCPLRGSMFGMMTLCLMLFAGLVYDINGNGTETFARILLWIGIVGHLFMTIVKFGEYISRPLEWEHVHASWMILPVGNLVAALLCPIVPLFEDNVVVSVECAWIFFSIGVFMWFPLFTMTFQKAIVNKNHDGRLRPMLFIWIAAPAVAGLAFWIMTTVESLPANQTMFFRFDQNPYCTKIDTSDYATFTGLGAFFRICVFLSLILFGSLLWAFSPRLGFYGQDPVGLECWNYVFPTATLSAIFLVYHMLVHTPCTEAVAIILLSIATLLTGVCFLHTANKLIRLQMFRPDDKWGPLSFMKLTHEAFRGALSNLVARCEEMDVTKPHRLVEFASILKSFEVLHAEHSLHEDSIIFKHFNDLFPEQANKFNVDHHEDHVLFARWNEEISVVLDGSLTDEVRTAAIVKFQDELPDFVSHLKAHLAGEENHMNPIGRKMVPLAIQKEISRKVWEATSAERWEIIVPFIINNLSRPGQRVRYIKTLIWAMPERAQQVGAIIYRNVDAVMWETVSVPVPDIIPRGAPNWRRYY